MNKYKKYYDIAKRRAEKACPHRRKQYRKARYRNAASRFNMRVCKIDLSMPNNSWDLYRKQYEPWLY